MLSPQIGEIVQGTGRLGGNLKLFPSPFQKIPHSLRMGKGLKYILCYCIFDKKIDLKASLMVT